MTLTPEILAHLTDLEERATPGPWRAVSRSSGVDDSHTDHDDPVLGWEVEPLETPQRGQFVRGADAHLTADLRNHARALIDAADVGLVVGNLEQVARELEQHRAPYGSEPEADTSTYPRCPGCRVAVGQPHQKGCDHEYCVDCEQQVILCSCAMQQKAEAFDALLAVVNKRRAAEQQEEEDHRP